MIRRNAGKPKKKQDKEKKRLKKDFKGYLTPEDRQAFRFLPKHKKKEIFQAYLAILEKKNASDASSKSEEHNVLSPTLQVYSPNLSAQKTPSPQLGAEENPGVSLLDLFTGEAVFNNLFSTLLRLQAGISRTNNIVLSLKAGTVAHSNFDAQELLTRVEDCLGFTAVEALEGNVRRAVIAQIFHFMREVTQVWARSVIESRNYYVKLGVNYKNNQENRLCDAVCHTIHYMEAQAPEHYLVRMALVGKLLLYPHKGMTSGMPRSDN